MTKFYLGNSSTTGATDVKVTWNEYVKPVDAPEEEPAFGYDSLKKNSLVASLSAVAALFAATYF